MPGRLRGPTGAQGVHVGGGSEEEGSPARNGVARVPPKQGFPGVSSEAAARDGEVLQVRRVRRVVSRSLAGTAGLAGKGGEFATELGLAFEGKSTQSDRSQSLGRMVSGSGLPIVICLCHVNIVLSSGRRVAVVREGGDQLAVLGDKASAAAISIEAAFPVGFVVDLLFLSVAEVQEDDVLVTGLAAGNEAEVVCHRLFRCRRE